MLKLREDWMLKAGHQDEAGSRLNGDVPERVQQPVTVVSLSDAKAAEACSREPPSQKEAHKDREGGRGE